MSLSPHSEVECLRALQNAPLRLTYKAEGAANIIYNIVTLNPEDKIHENCCVMRMRKDLAANKPCRESVDEFQQSIAPLFSGLYSKLLMSQVLFKLTLKMISDTEEELRYMEVCDSLASRLTPKRSGYHPLLQEEEYGILMPNMNQGGKSTFVEFKPKWLLQSVSAPINSLLCRTCALNATRRAKGKKKGRGDSGFCPLDLLCTDGKILSQALQSIWNDEDTLHQFVESFCSQVQPALVHLRNLQLQYNQVGLDDFRDPNGKNLPIAMALRDCSVFLEVTLEPASSKPKISNVKLADLDLKTTTAEKLERWANIEEDLIEHGGYKGLLGGADTCALRRRIPI